ncbi:DUF4326 domain-containing protein [Rhodococcus pyridinivorans]|uniref:DUF4326 domain-containing protein n=1 Tax=Rhodococcus pyridinivorans TaxID=103816 RepID=UPI000BA26D2B|nr:DUF4326 domain-containing protein [Rhodococcus pyridinivorans]
MRPRRIQRKRIAGWQMPECAVYVGRPTKWGNPIGLSDVAAQYPRLDELGIATLVVRDFRVLAEKGRLSFPNWRYVSGGRGPVSWTYPSVEEIRAELAGRDLACWCPHDQPCHADVLLEIANRNDGAGACGDAAPTPSTTLPHDRESGANHES